MARGYIVKTPDSVTVYLAIQGHVSEASKQTRFLSLPTEPGIYRFSGSFDTHAYFINTMLIDPVKELQRLRQIASKPRLSARTGSPGIKGYQEAENASYGAQRNRWNETDELIKLLENLVRKGR